MKSQLNQNRQRLTTVFILASSVLSLAAETSSWTGWRGNKRDARVAEFIPPKVWPEKLEKKWTAIVGDGYATPIVIGDHLFQHARENGKEVLHCLDLENGKELWKAETPVEFVSGRGGERHGLGPKSTPTIADGRIFTLSITGIISAWSAKDGTPLWRRDFQESFDQAHPYWGSATSPIVDQGKLFVHTGSCENGALFCLDPKTGKNLWVNKTYANCYSSPLIETIDGVRQLIELNHSGLCGFEITSGQLLWRHPFTHHGNNQNTPTPIRHMNYIIVGGENRGMFAIHPKRTKGKWTAERIWKHRKVSFDMSSPVINDGLVYGFSEFKKGRIACLDPNSGKVLWEGAPGAGKNAQFLSLPGHLLCLTDDGKLRVLRSSAEKYEELRTYQVAEGNTWTAPALVRDSLLIKAGEELSLWHLPNGKN